MRREEIFFATKARRHEGARRGDCHDARDLPVNDECFIMHLAMTFYGHLCLELSGGTRNRKDIFKDSDFNEPLLCIPIRRVALR
jgi:hypothetical protein